MHTLTLTLISMEAIILTITESIWDAYFDIDVDHDAMEAKVYVSIPEAYFHVNVGQHGGDGLHYYWVHLRCILQR